ncbi:hypothetical protein D3C87_1389130 [compost metagenome]
MRPDPVGVGACAYVQDALELISCARKAAGNATRGPHKFAVADRTAIRERYASRFGFDSHSTASKQQIDVPLKPKFRRSEQDALEALVP